VGGGSGNGSDVCDQRFAHPSGIVPECASAT
jgi:hypothetical protein